MAGRLTKNQSGDTIVEVLIAITVMAFIVAGAYVATNTSLLNERRSGEQSVALQLIQAQLEDVKTLIANSVAMPPIGTNFCISTNNTVQSPTSDTSPLPACVLDPSGNQTTVVPNYRIDLVQQPAGQFTATANWDRLNGGQEQGVSLTYKIQ